MSGNCFSSLKLRAATHWGTLKSGGLSESERHLVGPIDHISLWHPSEWLIPKGEFLGTSVNTRGWISDGLRKLDLSHRAIANGWGTTSVFHHRWVCFFFLRQPVVLKIILFLSKITLSQVAQANDYSMTSELTNHLFQGLFKDEEDNVCKVWPSSEPGKDYGLDLASLNIQRGREFGTPSYNKWQNLRSVPCAWWCAFLFLCFQIPGGGSGAVWVWWKDGRTCLRWTASR